ncbi:sterol esterase [Hypoxylon fragiforme]|uniref:sterol esterase n=1 Tax=Hypoxylon fragiforme TaxID=63214 RepID=UPI0020C5D729|nr:sterol esterase [Hypoxylon fragiforme]KAI2611266.1 sterol esterase [Hypoxylon fragiforme]
MLYNILAPLASTAAIFASLTHALPAPTQTEDKRVPTTTVVTAQGTVIGAVGVVENFAGIPFAQAPVGNLRLRPPQRLNTSYGTLDATGLGPACPQMFFSTGGDLFTSAIGSLTNLPLLQVATDQTEDCLTMRVQRPVGTKPDAKLPVLFWIFGGGFELGSPQMYDGAPLLSEAVPQGKPFILVSVNYRVGAFGFMGGKEVLADGAANLGLLDQRMGLEWVQDNIADFGGDPEKVTIWGESAGAMSVFDQMALYDGDNTYKGKKLFRAAIMNSGSLVPTDPVDCPRSQDIYDTVVREAGCTHASDTLQCLRETPYDKFLHAANSVPGILSYTSMALSYLPRPDGVALRQSPEILARDGKYAAVPMIIGNQEDEGTMFSLFQANVTTTAELVDYLWTNFFPALDRSVVAGLVATYDPSPAAGSPYNTGLLNAVYPQFKRLAAILGDMSFVMTRRIFLSHALSLHPDIPAWSYLSSFDYGTPVLGTVHASDVLQVYFSLVPNPLTNYMKSYYIDFVVDMDPNAGLDSAMRAWPRYEGQGGEMMQFWAGGRTNLLSDDFRNASYAYLKAHAEVLHL